MSIRLAAAGALAYALVTFPLAVLWHAVLFRSFYDRFGYFEGEPSFALGLLTIVIQGAILSLLYPHVAFAGSGVGRGLKYALAMGGFFWTSHVLAFLAKQQVDGAALFLAMETGYLAVQFGVFGLLIGAIAERLSVPEAGAA